MTVEETAAEMAQANVGDDQDLLETKEIVAGALLLPRIQGHEG
jgi:hypothetical protein